MAEEKKEYPRLENGVVIYAPPKADEVEDKKAPSKKTSSKKAK